MIKEIINFMEVLPDEFKTMGSLPKEGLHILVHQRVNADQIVSIDLDDFQYELYSKKDTEVSAYLEGCKLRHQNAWCINTNKCFDLPIKAIHSCSPFVVAFKREHLKGGGKYQANEKDKNKKKQIYERFDLYFEKAFQLFEQEENTFKYEVFKHFFAKDQFSFVLDKIEKEFAAQKEELLLKQLRIKEAAQETKESKDQVKIVLKELDQQLLKVRELTDGDYIIFYLDLSIEDYKKVHKKYLDDKLFNTDKYNTVPDDEGLIYGTSNFMNGFNSNMPFLLHQTASFDISGRISNIEAKQLYDFAGLLPNKVLPNPLPLFVYENELNEEMIGLMRESGFTYGYQEIIQKIVDYHQRDIGNYYLLFWQNTKDGLVFRDFDFVSRFEYKMGDREDNGLKIDNFFDVSDEKVKRSYILIKDIFHLESVVLKPLLENKYKNRIDYFSDLDEKGYEELPYTFQSYSKFRKTVYDYVYKSQRHLIDASVFYEMVFNAIKDNIKNGYGKGVKEKLNIWYSAQHYFNQKNKSYMGNKLKEYQDFVEELISDTGLEREATDSHFAFTAGMVIIYILNQSKREDKNYSYSLLEPYLQQSRCLEFKKAITNDFARYKHERFSKKFERAAAFVLSYETNTDLKKLLPEILSGVFANNQLYNSK